MVSHLFFYQLLLIALVWLCVMLQWVWPSDPAACPTTLDPTPPRPKRNRAPRFARRLARSRRCKSSTMKVERTTSAPSRAEVSVRRQTKSR